RANAVGLEQGQDALRADKAELPARERRRARHAAGDESRLGVEVEAQADDVARHLALPRRGHACNRHSIVPQRSRSTTELQRSRTPTELQRWRATRSASLSTAPPAASARPSIWPML